MWNETSKEEIKDVLSVFDDNSIFSLAATVTNGLLKNKVKTREEALQAIIHYSPTALNLLRRKMITREVIFSYIHRKKIPVKLPASKSDLIEKIAAVWNFQYEEETTQSNTSTEVIEVAPEPSPITLLAEQFSQWFYSMLNQEKPIDVEHFFPDAKLKINMAVNGEVMVDLVENDPQEICNRLFVKKKQNNLYFNPNLTKEGVQGRMDSHGIVLVLVCGTLHTSSVCVGVFEQIFGLARDPFAENNWKVKLTELNLRSQGGVLAPPKLCDNEFTSNLLSLPSS